MICPYCRGGVRDGAEKCWHCGAELTGNLVTGAAGAPESPLAGGITPPPEPPLSNISQPLEPEPGPGAEPDLAGLGVEPEPVITMLSDDEKQQFVVVEGYTNSDPLDFDHLKYLLFSPEGRINRRRYWIGSILNSMAVFVFGTVSYFISPKLMLLVMLCFMYPGLMLMIKRCHDRDRSGHFVWLFAIPIISLWPGFELAFVRGTRGVNRFGPDPL